MSMLLLLLFLLLFLLDFWRFNLCVCTNFMKYHCEHPAELHTTLFSAQSLFITTLRSVPPDPLALHTNSCCRSILMAADTIRCVSACVLVCLYLRYITPKSIFIGKSLHMFSLRHRLEITTYSSFSWVCEQWRERDRGGRANDHSIGNYHLEKWLFVDGLIFERKKYCQNRIRW